MAITYLEIEAELRRAFPVIPRIDVEIVRIRAFEITGRDIRAASLGGVAGIVEKFKSALPADAILTEATVIDGRSLLYAHQMRDTYFLLVQSESFPVLPCGASFEAFPVK